MTGRFRLVVFDWDGTLVDSLGAIVAAMQATIADLGLPARSESALRAGIGLGFDEVVTRLFPSLPPAERARVRDVYRDHFLAGDRRARLFAGAHDALTRLAAGGATLAVATGKGRAGLDRELDETGLRDLMVATRCVDDCASTPAPDMLEELMRHAGHGAHETVMVGDSEYDLMMARNAGTACVGVAGGAHAHERLLRHRPLAVIDSVADLPAVLAAQPA